MKVLFVTSLIITTIFISQLSLAQKSITAYPIHNPPVIDGTYEPEKWMNADTASQFIQLEPRAGAEASEKTVSYIGYDKENIYVTFICYQKTNVIAKNQSRDALSKNDDIVVLMLDTYHDNRSGYAFFVSPLGTQIDMKINDDGRNVDLNWDTEWKCASKTFDWGWSTELQIPFKSLKYKKNIDTWGINFGRIIRSNSETCYWSGVLTEDFRISQGGKMTSIKAPGSKVKLSVFPYLSVFKTNKEKLDASAGGDIQMQLGSNISLNATINPDFATVEADQQVINLTRYEISYPEKRIFFQEGNEMFNTRIKTFYSRRIQDIDYGARLIGKVGKTQFNLLNVKSPETAADKPSYYMTAARVKYDFLTSSSVGATLVDKSWNNGFTRSFSLDYILNFAKTWQATGQFVGSSPGDFWNHSAGYFRIANENSIYHYHVRYTQIGEKFRETVNQTGFVPDDNRKEIDSDITYKWWQKNNALKYIDFQSMNNIFWSISGTLRSWYITDLVNFYFHNRINVQYSYNNEFKLYEKEFYNHAHAINLGYNTEEWSHVSLGYTRGKNYDRDFTLFRGEGRVKVFKKLSLSYSLNMINFHPDPNYNTTVLNALTANYNFTNDLWLKFFAQSSSAYKDFYLYGLFGWRFKPPFGALYLIYSQYQSNNPEGVPNSNNLFLKLTLPLTILK
jgi:hypothetical protein